MRIQERDGEPLNVTFVIPSLAELSLRRINMWSPNTGFQRINVCKCALLWEWHRFQSSEKEPGALTKNPAWVVMQLSRKPVYKDDVSVQGKDISNLTVFCPGQDTPEMCSFKREQEQSRNIPRRACCRRNAVAAYPGSVSSAFPFQVFGSLSFGSQCTV